MMKMMRVLSQSRKSCLKLETIAPSQVKIPRDKLNQKTKRKSLAICLVTMMKMMNIDLINYLEFKSIILQNLC